MTRTRKPRVGGFIAAALAAACASEATARGPGSTSGLFLALGNGSRPVGMGEAFVATADDANSINWNPAGLGLLTRPQASLMYMNYWERTYFGSARGGFQIKKRGEPLATMGIAFAFFSGGQLKGADPGGALSGNFTPLFLNGSIGLGWSSDRFPDWNFGFAIKFIYETINGQGSASGAIDAGAQWRTPARNLIAAVAVQNFGPSLAGPDPLPQTLRFGLAYRVATMRKQRISVESDLVHLVRQDTFPLLQSGVEYVYLDMFFVRAGFVARVPKNDLSMNAGIRAGFGLRLWKRIQFDYAYQGSGLLYSDAHRFDVTYGF